MRRLHATIATIITVAGLTGTVLASAPSASAAPATSIDTSPCDITLQAWGTYCLPPNIPYPFYQDQYCSLFPNGMEYETATDAAGVPQMWTYSNGGHPCIEVDYYPGDIPGQECHYWMYIPDNGYADANVIIGWWTTNSTTHITTKYYAAVVHEATTAGWIELNMQEPGHPDGGAADVNTLQFKDNNGQTGTVIGWGANKYYGIKEVCY